MPGIWPDTKEGYLIIKPSKMKEMKLSAMELIIAGDKNCDYVTGFMCGATAILAFSGIFAPLAGATGVGCAVGLASGCGPK